MRILIGYDGSESADAVSEDLKKAGLPPDTQASIVSVGDLPLGNRTVREAVEAISAGSEKPQTHAAKVLEELKEYTQQGKRRVLESFQDWSVSSEIFLGTPAWDLSDAANKLKADLIFVGSQGRSALGRLFLGSVSKRVATDANCSVRVSRSNVQKTSNDSNTPPRIIVGVDGSPAAEQAIFSVGQRVWQDGTEVRLVTVDETVQPRRIASRLPQAAAMINSYFQTRAKRVSEMLEWGKEELNNIGLETSILRGKGGPKSVLIDEAKKWNADSIFVGTRDFKSAFERFELGSVSTYVLTNAPCSVEVVRPPDATQQ